MKAYIFKNLFLSYFFCTFKNIKMYFLRNLICPALVKTFFFCFTPKFQYFFPCSNAASHVPTFSPFQHYYPCSNISSFNSTYTIYALNFFVHCVLYPCSTALQRIFLKFSLKSNWKRFFYFTVDVRTSKCIFCEILSVLP